MDFKGTKGKWDIGGNADGGVYITCENPVRDIAVVYHYEDERPENEVCKANAKLIINAPELYQALDHCLKIMERLDVPQKEWEEYGNAVMNYSNLLQETAQV